MPDPDLNFVLARLDRMQKELGLMRLANEQREASFQALTLTLSRQMVELGQAVEEQIGSLGERLGRIEERLDQGDEKLITLSNQIGELRGLVVDIVQKIDARAE